MEARERKGAALEKAVLLIQETLLETDPALKGGRFTIEPNKCITVNGTRHEIDVYVVTQPDTAYQSVVIFECKDWEAPVSKNEVLILKGKVEQLGATRGILVAPKLSRDAEALVANYRDILYRRCSDDISRMLGIHAMHIVHDPLKITVSVTPRFSTQSIPDTEKGGPPRRDTSSTACGEYKRGPHHLRNSAREDRKI